MSSYYFEGYKKLSWLSEDKKEDVKIIEERYQIHLPGAYIEFIYRIGDILLDDWFGGGVYTRFEDIDFIIKISEEVIAEERLILEAFFPFANYSGDQFFFFYLTDGDNPPVYKFDLEFCIRGENMIPDSNKWGLPKGIIKCSETFTQFITTISETQNT